MSEQISIGSATDRVRTYIQTTKLHAPGAWRDLLKSMVPTADGHLPSIPGVTPEQLEEELLSKEWTHNNLLDSISLYQCQFFEAPISGLSLHVSLQQVDPATEVYGVQLDGVGVVAFAKCNPQPYDFVTLGVMINMGELQATVLWVGPPSSRRRFGTKLLHGESITAAEALTRGVHLAYPEVYAPALALA